MKVVLGARREERLKSLREEIKSNGGKLYIKKLMLLKMKM